MIQQVRLPLTVHVCRMVWRNLIIFGHHAIIIIGVLCLYGYEWKIDLLSVPAAIALIGINGVWVGIVLGVFCTRFRDISQIVSSIVQILFYVTPILWPPQMFTSYTWVIRFNPLYHFIELIRAPSFGEPFPTESWVMAGGVTILGIACAIAVLARFRKHVPYWV